LKGIWIQFSTTAHLGRNKRTSTQSGSTYSPESPKWCQKITRSWYSIKARG